MDSTTSFLSASTSPAINTAAATTFNRRNNEADADAFSARFQEQYQYQQQQHPSSDNKSFVAEDRRNVESNPVFSGNTAPESSQSEPVETSRPWDENVENNRNTAGAVAEPVTPQAPATTEKNVKAEEKTTPEQQKNPQETTLTTPYAESAAANQQPAVKNTVKKTVTAETEVISDIKTRKITPENKETATTAVTDKIAKKTATVQDKIPASAEKEIITATAAATVVKPIKSESSVNQMAAASAMAKNEVKNTAAPRTQTTAAEENDFKSGKELENLSGIKINRISRGNTLASQTGNNNNANADSSGGENRNLLQSLADKSSHLQQKLQAQTNTANSGSAETAAGALRTVTKTSTSTVETAGTEKNKISATSMNDKNLLSGLDMLRRNDVAAVMKEAQLNPASASTLTERIAGVQQLAEKISETLSGQDSIKGQGITLDFESESMGRMQLFLQQKGNAVKIVFEPGSESCRQQLQDQQQDLARELRAMGYDNLSLNVTDNRQQNNSRQQEKNAASGNDDIDNVKLAGDDQSDLAQLLAV